MFPHVRQIDGVGGSHRTLRRVQSDLPCLVASYTLGIFVSFRMVDTVVAGIRSSQDLHRYLSPSQEGCLCSLQTCPFMDSESMRTQPDGVPAPDS